MKMFFGIAFALLASNIDLNKSSMVEMKNENILKGVWGWSDEQCANNLMTISFSSDSKIIYHDSPKGMFLGDGENPHIRSKYIIHSQSLNRLRTSIEGEDRKDAEGKFVSWDVVILNENTFCWSRTDWKPGSCTKNMFRCE
jgi:hypothetical protein